MAEMPNVDPNFEPQSRPRSGTWPMNRPNIEPRRNRMQQENNLMLTTTMEESNSQEMLANEEDMTTEPISLLTPDSFLEFGNVLIGSPTASRVTDFSAISSSPMIKTEQGLNSNNILSDYCTSTTITELSNMSSNQNFDNRQAMQQQSANLQCQNNSDVTASYSSPGNTTLSKTSSPTTTVTGTQSGPSTAGATPKTKSTRKNAWGNMSYADLITQAIESSPEQRLTLAQIYEWMVKNVPYFKDKGDSNSSAGWKNSIRHNLSLHSKFKRIQNEGTGKSSWWVINHDAKPGKSPRRRAISMDNGSAKFKSSRNKAKSKADLIKKKNAGLKQGQTVHRDSGSWGTSSMETPISKALGSEYRQRASSNASSLGGRMSPSRHFLPLDLEDDGPPLSPLSGSINNLANLSTSLPSAFAIFEGLSLPPDNSPSTIPEGVTTDQLTQENLSESLANMEVTYQGQDMFNLRMNGSTNQSSSNAAQSTPHLASLLQSTSNVTKVNQTSGGNGGLAKIEQQSYESQKSAPYPYDYQNQQMDRVQTSPQYKNVMQQQPVNEGKPLYHYSMPQQSQSNEGQMYQNPQGQARQQSNYMQQQQQQGGMQAYLQQQQQSQSSQMVTMDNQPGSQYSASPNTSMLQGIPDDLNSIKNQELLNLGDVDLEEMLRSTCSNDAPYNFNMDFDMQNNNYYQNSCQPQMQQSGGYNMGMDGSGNLSQQQPPLHPNPDVFINPNQAGNPMMMMDGCRMNNLQQMQQGQTPSIGANSRYSMQ